MAKLSDRKELAKKPKKCPSCGAIPVATILYGLPAMSEKLEEDMKSGRVSLGGCCISDDDPKWECTHCGLMIYQKKGT